MYSLNNRRSVQVSVIIFNYIFVIVPTPRFSVCERVCVCMSSTNYFKHTVKCLSVNTVLKLYYIWTAFLENAALNVISFLKGFLSLVCFSLRSKSLQAMHNQVIMTKCGLLAELCPSTTRTKLETWKLSDVPSSSESKIYWTISGTKQWKDFTHSHKDTHRI